MSQPNLTEDLNIVANSNLEIELLDGDLNIIQKLDDEPNDVGGLTSAELKETFDKAGNIIKDYLNNQLIPAIISADATEAARAAAEAQREANENQRIENENARIAAEQSRTTAESARADAETERAAAESARNTAEQAREAAEQARADENTGIVAQATEQANIASSAATSAGNSATEAAASKSAAASSAISSADRAAAASTSETNAKASETAAKASEEAAKASENAAKASENAAKASETAAKQSEITAKSEADRAKSEADRAADIVGGDYVTKTDLSAHTDDTDIHVTASEKTAWNAKADVPFKPTGKSYLTFSSPNSFTLEVGDATKHWDGTLEYFASDKTWTIWDGTTTLSSVDNYGEYVLYLRGTGNTIFSYRDEFSYEYVPWVINGTNVRCNGNIETLLDYATVESEQHPTMADYCFASLFSGCTALTQAPALPATTLADHCYAYMFSDCTNLTQAPALPATTLTAYCYQSMFHGCTGLTQAPALPATTLTAYCYQSMLSGCTSLTQTPALPATTLTESCYSGMFSNCTSLTQAPALPATTLADECYYYMFGRCTGLTQAPALPATTLTAYCYMQMFRGCTSLKLSSTQTGEYTQEYRIPTTGTATATDALDGMFTGTGGTFTGTPEINTTYYLSSDNMVVRETEIATLNGYVGSMIDVATPKSVTVTLAAASWDSTAKTQTVTVTGVKASETAQMITPTPALASQTAYYDAGILCTGQAADSLTFTANTIPTADLTVYVVIQEVAQG